VSVLVDGEFVEQNLFLRMCVVIMALVVAFMVFVLSRPAW